ncbi:hypothetical protein C7B79_21195 [Chroococcidiopsis cubana CCALA 043]|nr:hypothetical protein C7B79_21195 [Chroococcidiopsis cubana CCALA 043]
MDCQNPTDAPPTTGRTNASPSAVLSAPPSRAKFFAAIANDQLDNPVKRHNSDRGEQVQFLWVTFVWQLSGFSKTCFFIMLCLALW